MSDRNLVIGVVGLLLVLGVVLYVTSGQGENSVTPPGTTSSVTASSSPIAAFAQCLKDQGVIFYGAFWCPHCQNEKALFGVSKRLLPYVECSTSDGRGQLPICQEKLIMNYPTWEFADKSRETGEVQLAKLSEKTGCLLPAE